MNALPTSERTLPIPAEYVALMKETEQNPKYHAEGNVYNHTLLVLEQFQKHSDLFDLNQSDKEVLYWAALLHDIGKPEVTIWKNGRWSARGHEVAGVSIARNILMQRPEVSLEQRHRILDLVRWHSVPLRWGLRREKTKAYKKLATQTDMRLLGVFAYFDLKGRLCESPEIVSALIHNYNDHLLPQIEKDMGTFSDIQSSFHEADIQKKNALWHSLRLDDIRLLEKLLQTPGQVTRFSPFHCTLLIGLSETDPERLRELYPSYQPFELPYATGEARQKLVRTLKNAIHIYAQAGTPLVFYGDLLDNLVRDEITRIVRHVGGEIRYVFIEQTLNESLGDTADISEYDSRYQFYRRLLRPHPWEAHKWEFRSSLNPKSDF